MFGVQHTDTLSSSDGAAIKAVTDNLPNSGALTDIASGVTSIQAVTDSLPNSGALTDISGEVTAIKAVTDNLPDSGALTSISSETDKIDSAAADGLGGVVDSAAYKTAELEGHVHHYERWFEVAAVPDGEAHVADEIGSGSGSFVLDAGNNDWGNWVQLLGSSDTPAIAGDTHYDPHELQITAAERTATYYIQLVAGASGAAGLAAETYSNKPFTPQSVQGKPDSLLIGMKRQAVGTKLWARCKCPGQNTATLGVLPGIHEYEG